MDHNNNPCQWCKQTSSEIDSIEYQNEILKSQNETLKQMAILPLAMSFYDMGSSKEDALTAAEIEIDNILEEISNNNNTDKE